MQLTEHNRVLLRAAPLACQSNIRAMRKTQVPQPLPSQALRAEI